MSKGRSFALYLVGVVLLVVAALGVFLLSTERTRSAHAEADARSRAVAARLTVMAVQARRSPPVRERVLQGEARSFLSVTLYAKLSGYLKTIRVDKGDHVKANEVVGVIESPELEKQYQAAVADAKQKHLTSERAEKLRGPGVVSAQEADLALSAARIADAQVQSLAAQLEYRVLRAPFAGTVTARFADPGALLQQATGAQTSALPIVTVSTVDRLRVYVWLDQHDAPFVKEGDPARVLVPEHPGEFVDGKITRTAKELDGRTRMMLTEIDLDNRAGRIVPGSFVSVSIRIEAPSYVEVPVGALLLRGKQTVVPTVASDDTIHFHEVQVADDDGQLARLVDGALHEGDWVALEVGDVAEGAHVQAKRQQPPQQGQPQQGQPPQGQQQQGQPQQGQPQQGQPLQGQPPQGQPPQGQPEQQPAAPSTKQGGARP